MDNIVVTVEGDKLTLVIDLSAPTTPSASGKTLVIASSRGNQEVAPGIFAGVNVYKKKG